MKICPDWNDTKESMVYDPDKKVWRGTWNIRGEIINYEMRNASPD